MPCGRSSSERLTREFTLRETHTPQLNIERNQTFSVAIRWLSRHRSQRPKGICDSYTWANSWISGFDVDQYEWPFTLQENTSLNINSERITYVVARVQSNGVTESSIVWWWSCGLLGFRYRCTLSITLKGLNHVCKPPWLRFWTNTS